ncbi:MAG: hypothetical protein DDT28_00656 [Dehalococcoidia bacterium]|nr:hypothetical protein [Chloroflexota bacterium]
MASNSAAQVSTSLYVGTIPISFLLPRSSSSSVFKRSASCLSEKPILFASSISSRGMRFEVWSLESGRTGILPVNWSLSTLDSRLVMFLTFSRNQGSILVSSATSSTRIPLLKASATRKILSATGNLSLLSNSSPRLSGVWSLESGRTGILPVNWSPSPRDSGLSTLDPRLVNPYFPISNDLTAFCKASSNVLPSAIASPIDFICVVSVLSASGNLSKGHRGILTTT